MTSTTESLPSDSSPGPRRFTRRGCAAGSIAICHVAFLLTLSGCAPPTEVVNLDQAPQATRDAMLQVKIQPLGTPAPPGVGSIGPISGYGCGPTTDVATSEALRQLQVKAMRVHASAVLDVLVGPADGGFCVAGHGMTATGIAAAPRGIAPSY